MNKDCNGCFGAAGDDCQRCQGVDEVTPPKLDITSELIISAHNTQMDYCETIKAFGDCNKCIFTQLSHLGIIHYQDRPCTQRRIILPSLTILIVLIIISIQIFIHTIHQMLMSRHTRRQKEFI